MAENTPRHNLTHPSVIKTAVMSLLASRSRDFGDVMGVIGKPAAQLDLDYLWSWAERLGLQSELHYRLIAAKP